MSKKRTVQDNGMEDKEELRTEEVEKEVGEQEECDDQQEGAETLASAPGDEEGETRYLRLAADFQNFKRRVEKEKNDIYAYANEKIVVELLDVIDNFERALDHTTEADRYAEGMNMIFKQFKGVLEKSGLEEITSAGEVFDPNFHHAVMTASSAEHESGRVMEVFQKGYLLNKKVIRPAMVKVAE